MKILVCFDGTGNQPIDAEQNALKDNDITNVLKLHLLAGGDLSPDLPLRGAGRVAGQQSLYFSGVGTRGHIGRRLFRKAFAGLGPRRWIEETREILARIYEEEDSLHVFGFSRGAAIARQFLSDIAAAGLQTRSGKVIAAPDVALLGVWDTVASFGLPELAEEELPEVGNWGKTVGSPRSSAKPSIWSPSTRNASLSAPPC